MVRVRIAPSPTGIPHIGNTRTALFNYLFARHHNGKFLLRIEDTDQKRIVPGAKEAIIEILDWLGIAVDERYIQSSDRLGLYKNASEFLQKRGFARKEEGAVRFVVPREKSTIEWEDAVGNKRISFKTEDIENFIILKSDGFPTYHLASVVDDHETNISHVIRGEEWISSTPKHLLLYKALGFTPPIFAHLPIILGSDKTKLSKRHGAKSVLNYRDEGFLKEALINYMALLGWRPTGEKIIDKKTFIVTDRETEKMPLNLMIKLFDLADVNLANPIFDIKKLEWTNGRWIREIVDNRDNPYLKPPLETRIYEFYGKKYPIEMIEKTIPYVYERMKTLADYLPLCEFFFKEPETFELDLSSQKDLFRKVADRLEKSSSWDAESIGKTLQDTARELDIKNSEFFMLLRVAITGKKISPPLTESIEILGRQKTLERLARI